MTDMPFPLYPPGMYQVGASGRRNTGPGLTVAALLCMQRCCGRQQLIEKTAVFTMSRFKTSTLTGLQLLTDDAAVPPMCPGPLMGAAIRARPRLPSDMQAALAGAACSVPPQRLCCRALRRCRSWVCPSGSRRRAAATTPRSSDPPSSTPTLTRCVHRTPIGQLRTLQQTLTLTGNPDDPDPDHDPNPYPHPSATA